MRKYLNSFVAAWYLLTLPFSRRFLIWLSNYSIYVVHVSNSAVRGRHLVLLYPKVTVLKVFSFKLNFFEDTVLCFLGLLHIVFS